MSLLLTKGLGPAGGTQRVSRFDPANVQVTPSTKQFQIDIAAQTGPKGVVQAKVEFVATPTVRQDLTVTLSATSVNTTIR